MMMKWLRTFFNRQDAKSAKAAKESKWDLSKKNR